MTTLFLIIHSVMYVLSTVFFLKDSEFGMTFVSLVFLIVFLMGFRERKNLRSRIYSISHLYVGSILTLFFGGYFVLKFLFSTVNLLIDGELEKLTLSEMIVIANSIIALVNIPKLKKEFKKSEF